jgi:6-phosphogluconolactonase/glucosamine-6-phosphate isomerase/deaminase
VGANLLQPPPKLTLTLMTLMKSKRTKFLVSGEDSRT